MVPPLRARRRALPLALSALLALCAVRAAAGSDAAVASASASAAWAPFQPDEPAFGASATVRAERAAFAAACLARPGDAAAGADAAGAGSPTPPLLQTEQERGACGLGGALEALAGHYAALDRVFVLGARPRRLRVACRSPAPRGLRTRGCRLRVE